MGVRADEVVVRVTHKYVAVPVDAEAARPAVAEVGRLPRNSQVIPVEIVSLDARGEVDEIDAALGVDGNRPRPGDVAGHFAMLAIQEVRRAVPPAAGEPARREEKYQGYQPDPNRSHVVSKPDSPRRARRSEFNLIPLCGLCVLRGESMAELILSV